MSTYTYCFLSQTSVYTTCVLQVLCGQCNCVNYKAQVELHNMHMYTTDFLNVMDEHTTAVSDTVSLDLTYFSNKFIESGFITQTAASEVLSKLGVSAGDRSRELLHLARQNYKTSLKKQVWADKFIAIFSSQAAYSDLATLLRGETSTAGVANIAISSTNCCEIIPTPFIPRSNDMILYWTRTVQFSF